MINVTGLSRERLVETVLNRVLGAGIVLDTDNIDPDVVRFIFPERRTVGHAPTVEAAQQLLQETMGINARRNTVHMQECLELSHKNVASIAGLMGVDSNKVNAAHAGLRKSIEKNLAMDADAKQLARGSEMLRHAIEQTREDALKEIGALKTPSSPAR